MEAVNIIQFHQQLQKAIGECQLLWHSKLSGRKYRRNVVFEGDTDKLVNEINQTISEWRERKEEEFVLIHLTINNNIIYYDIN